VLFLRKFTQFSDNYRIFLRKRLPFPQGARRVREHSLVHGRRPRGDRGPPVQPRDLLVQGERVSLGRVAALFETLKKINKFN
jgi:hypothetical protein